MPTISQGGKSRSSDERVMQNAGDKNAIDWQIFRTYIDIVNKSQATYAHEICKLSVTCLHCIFNLNMYYVYIHLGEVCVFTIITCIVSTANLDAIVSKRDGHGYKT